MTSRCGVLVHIEGTNQRYRSAGTLIIHIHVGIAIILLGKKGDTNISAHPKEEINIKKSPKITSPSLTPA